jgi:hypothetical protein
MQVIDGCKADRSGLCASMVCTIGMLTERQAASSLAAGARQVCIAALSSRQISDIQVNKQPRRWIFK